MNHWFRKENSKNKDFGRKKDSGFENKSNDYIEIGALLQRNNIEERIS